MGVRGRSAPASSTTSSPTTLSWPATNFTAAWRQLARGSVVARALGADAVTGLLNSCDRHTVAGMRDFAILTLLARLGLRAGEVAALTLEDIDWHHGEMVVRGKGGRQERLPLPADVGEAVVTYLRHRPEFACRALFLKVRAPVTGLS